MTQKPLSPQRNNHWNERVVEQRLLLTMANGCYLSLISASVTEHHDTSNAGEEQHIWFTTSGFIPTGKPRQEVEAAGHVHSGEQREHMRA